MPPPRHVLASSLLAAALAGCANGQHASWARPLSWLGLSPATGPRVDTASRVAWRLHASDRLNTDAEGRPMAVVLRLYRLRDIGAFQTAGARDFADDGAEARALGHDLVDARDVVLTPGQHRDETQGLTPEVRYVGVAARFHWGIGARARAAFRADEARASGITLGVHACSLSVTAGIPVGWPPDAHRVGGPPCL